MLHFKMLFKSVVKVLL